MKKIIVFCWRISLAFFVFATAPSAIAADRVAVIPLSSGATTASNFVTVEKTFTWTCPPAVNSLAFQAECPTNCLAIGGGCSAKEVEDISDINVSGGNFNKTDTQLSHYNAYQCWMLVSSCSDPGDPPVGYAQVSCFCPN